MRDFRRDWYSVISASGTSAVTAARWPGRASLPLMRARFVARSPVMSPMEVAGAVISMRTTGSSTMGFALWMASRNALRPAETNATSFESTE